MKKLSILLVLLLSFPSVIDSCPTQFIAFGTSCYFVSQLSTQVNYAATQSACANMGASLVKIKSKSENDFVFSMLNPTQLYFTGFNDTAVEGSFNTMGYTNWYPGGGGISVQPDNAANEDCVVLWGNSGYWGDEACTAVAQYVCEADLACAIALPPCSSNCVYYNNYCYTFSTTIASYDSAYSSCMSMGGNLPRIATAAENSFIFSGVRAPDAWISYADVAIESYFGVSGYSNWYTGEPNNNLGNQNCVQFYGQGKVAVARGYWDDFTCASQLNFVCKSWLSGQCSPCCEADNSPFSKPHH